MHYGSIFSLLFVLTGTANVLLMKWVDNQESECKDGKLRRFQHPVLQTWLMFAGEFLCFLIYKLMYFFLQRRQNDAENSSIITRGNTNFSAISLLLPAFLDTIASVLLFMGLYLSYVSSFILIRMAVIIFVGIYGSICLNQRLIFRHWGAIFTISCGLLVVICMDVQRIFYDTYSLPHNDANAVLVGDFLILTGQIFQGAQYVYEEKLLKDNAIAPMHAVGWQGIFGLIITTILAVCMNYMPAVHPFSEAGVAVVDDIPNALKQIASNQIILGSLISFIFIVAIYNFTRLFFQKHTSTTSLVLNEPIRIMFVWLIVFMLNWEYFHLIIFFGFLIIMLGFMTYRTANFIELYRSLAARLRSRRYVYFGSDSSEPTIETSSRPADVI